MNPSISILMTGAGAPGAAGIIKCLTQEPAVRLIVADADENAIGKHLHPHFFQIPKAGEENFIERVLTLSIREKIDLVMPLVTKELFSFSQQRHRFEEVGIKVMVSPYEAIQIANDKGECYRFLQSKGIAVPAFFVVTTTEEFIQAAHDLGFPQKPLCFKPCVANGSRGFRIVSDSVNEAELLFNSKPYNTHLSYRHALEILSSQTFPPLVVTEYLPGDEYSVDCLAYRGKAVLIVSRLRQKMINGISVQGRFIEDETIISYCKSIIETIGLHGNIGVQLKRSVTGEPMLLEINPRVQGTIVAALGAGVNLPLLAVKQEMGWPLSAEEIKVRWGTAFSRYWTEVFH